MDDPAESTERGIGVWRGKAFPDADAALRRLRRVVHSDLSHFRHLTGRFFRTILARRKAGDRAFVEAYLGPTERELFFRQRLADQRHGIDLGARLRRDGFDDPDLIRAALLHDVGKSIERLPVACRVAYSACAAYAPTAARWLAEANRARWRRPFYLARHHARLGANAARQAGCSPRVVALIAGHEQAGDDDLSRLLYTYDRGE